MKKVIFLIFAVVMILVYSSCSMPEEISEVTYEIDNVKEIDNMVFGHTEFGKVTDYYKIDFALGNVERYYQRYIASDVDKTAEILEDGDLIGRVVKKMDDKETEYFKETIYDEVYSWVGISFFYKDLYPDLPEECSDGLWYIELNYTDGTTDKIAGDTTPKDALKLKHAFAIANINEWYW